MTVLLNGKNACGLLAGVCVVVLAVITILVPADRLSTPPGRYYIIGVAIVAIVAIAAQMFKQSREDHELGSKLNGVMAARGMLPDTSKPLREFSSQVTDSAIETASSVIDGEVYRIVMSPRSISWELVRDLFRMHGRSNEASIDTDILVEMYLVNASTKDSKYIRDLRLSGELINGDIVNFVRQDDLHAEDFNNTKFEYGLGYDEHQDKEPIKQLFSSLPFCLSPQQAVEGWVRFMANTNPDNLKEKAFKLRVVDSLGQEHFISRAATREQKGKIGLRRVSG
jgi:hypothetical protein